MIITNTEKFCTRIKAVKLGQCLRELEAMGLGERETGRGRESKGDG